MRFSRSCLVEFFLLMDSDMVGAQGSSWSVVLILVLGLKGSGDSDLSSSCSLVLCQSLCLAQDFLSLCLVAALSTLHVVFIEVF